MVMGIMIGHCNLNHPSPAQDWDHRQGTMSGLPEGETVVHLQKGRATTGLQ